MNARASTFESDLVDDNCLSAPAEPSGLSVAGVMQSLRNVATLSEVLRVLGAGVILVSMSVFLLQGWSEGNDIRRYLLLLAQTGLLGAAGFAMSHLIRETKGARLFFGLALASIPANFTILGALLYSVFQWDGGLTSYPGYAEWRIDDIANIGITISAALIVLVPVTLFCFAVMARHSAKSLSINFLLLNALLLLPIRSSLAAGSIALAGVFYALFAIRKVMRQNPALNTSEGRFALAALFIPLGIVLFRSMYFYEVDSLMIAMVGTVLFLVTRQSSRLAGRGARLAIVLELLSLPIALIVAVALGDAFSVGTDTGWSASVFSLTYSLFALDIVRRTRSSVLRTVTTSTVGAFVAGSLSLAVVVDPTAASALGALAGGLMLLLWGAAQKRPALVIAGVLALAAGGFFGLDALLGLILTSSWIELALFGASAIILGSVLDRHGAAMKMRLTRWYARAEREKAEIALDD